MHTHRFGRKLKLPSTVAIRHEILKLMMQDELKAQALAAKVNQVPVVDCNGAAEALIARDTPIVPDNAGNRVTNDAA